MLRLLHTADLHLGCEFAQLDAEDRRKLARARLAVVEPILALADQYAVDVVLWAGDIFDSANPADDWWKGFAKALSARQGGNRPIVLLPGNHDPLNHGSVFDPDHPFRQLLPPWVHVVDRDGFELAVGTDAVIYAAPCRSTAGAEDLALSLPARASGDTRIRVGLVHGSTFGMPGYQTNFPIATDAPRQRGLDYLAIGDTHGFREIVESGVAPIVYPGTPEPTCFDESGAGTIVIATLSRPGTRPLIARERVARWTWRDETLTSLAEVRRLASEDLSTTVLRLRLDMEISVTAEAELDGLINLLKGNLATTGRAGALIVDRTRLRFAVPPDGLGDAPETLRAVEERLLRDGSDEARRALQILYRMVAEAAS